MKTIRSIVRSFLAAAVALACVGSSWAQTAKTNEAESVVIAEGRRLVENVGMCADCHAQRLPTGEFDRTRWLQGAVLGFEPTSAMPWAAIAPSIAGLPGYTEAQAVRFLTTGERPRSAPVRPPMPAYRLNEAEAKAIVAYLMSLKQS